MREQYLENRGREIASSIDARMRGPGRRHNLEIWKETLEEELESQKDLAASLQLVDQDGSELAGARQAVSAPGGVHVFETPLPEPMETGRGMRRQVAGWRIRITLFESQANFFTRQGYTQLAVSAVAIITLLGLAAYFLRTLRRYLKLQEKEESERRLASLGKMAATLAHEIRNPLGAMKGLTQVVQEELPEDHRAQSLMQTVVSEAERLELLVADLLAFAKPREPHVAEFDLNRSIRSAAETVQSSAPGSNVETDGDSVPLLVRSDENAIRQVLLNVMLNAVQASPDGARVQVRASRNSRQVVIMVEDSGEGIGARDPEELFQPFVTTRVKGSGLGLAVSRQIVERLGGRIEISNRAGGGARCTVTIPG